MFAEVGGGALSGTGEWITGSVYARNMRVCSSAVTHDEEFAVSRNVGDEPLLDRSAGSVAARIMCGTSSLEDSESARVFGISSQVLQEGAGETTSRSTRGASSELSDEMSETAESSRFAWALTGDEGRCGPFQIED
jgi:hypothetical protein